MTLEDNPRRPRGENLVPTVSEIKILFCAPTGCTSSKTLHPGIFSCTLLYIIMTLWANVTCTLYSLLPAYRSHLVSQQWVLHYRGNLITSPHKGHINPLPHSLLERRLHCHNLQQRAPRLLLLLPRQLASPTSGRSIIIRCGK